MRDQLTRLEAASAVQRLCTAYGKPFGAKGEELAGLWYDKLRWWPGSVVLATVERWIEVESRFPNPAAIIARVKSGIPKTDAERNPADHDGTCPSCQTLPRVAGYERPNGTILGRVRCGCIPPGHGWATPAALAWREKAPPVVQRPAPVEDRGDAWED